MQTRHNHAGNGDGSPNTRRNPFFHPKYLKWEGAYPIRRIDVHDKYLGIPVTYFVVKDPADHDRTVAEFESELAARAWARMQERRAA